MLTDVAKVSDDIENKKLAAWMNERPAVIVNIQRQPGANTIAVVESIEKLLPKLKASLPVAVQMTVLSDRTNTIRASIEDVEFELLLTIALVVMVILVFLRNIMATLIPSVAVPLSLIGTLAAMKALGFSLNNLTMMAFTISTGFVVDDAIVMIENISRYREEGLSPREAALTGAGKIGFTIMALTVSLIVVLIPLLFMGDVVGRLFREFAVTLCATILISAAVSLTLTPMMSARLSPTSPESEQNRVYRTTERLFKRVIAAYGRSLRWVLGYQTVTLGVAAITLLATVALYIEIPKGFFPTQDTGIIQGISQAPETTSFAAMARKQQSLSHLILQDPAVASLSSFIGIDGTNTTLNSGRIQINLKPLEQRELSATQVIGRLRKSLRQVPGIELFMQPVQDLVVDDRASRTQYQYTMEDPDVGELNSATARFVDALRKLPELRDVTTDQQTEGLAATLTIDRATASRLNISTDQIDSALYDAFGQRQINTLYTQSNQYHVILEALPGFQVSPKNLNAIYLFGATSSTATTSTSGRTAASSNGTVAALNVSSSSGTQSSPSSALSGVSNSAANGPTSPTTALSPTSGSSGLSAQPTSALTSPAAATAATGGGATGSSAAAIPAPVPLSAISRFTLEKSPLTIAHQGQFPVVTLSFNAARGYSLGEAVSAVERAQRKLRLPASIQAAFQGTAAAYTSIGANELLLILAALFAVYVVLGILYESFIHPITILSTLPSAGLGALFALRLFRQDLDIVAVIGIVLLIGIVNKNGILIVDFALDAERQGGKSPTEAIFEASMLRFRPILMTTLAALFAGLPLALGSGMGSELRRPLGIAMVGGLLVSQILTLYTTPVIYIFFDRIARRLARGGSEPALETS
jgi:multidrug efflux pump